MSTAPPPSVDTTRSVVDAVIAVERDRGAAAQRPQLPRARVPRPRQRAGAELRPDQDEQRRDLLGRPARPRRQHHDRRRRTTTTTWWAGRSQNLPQDAVQEFQIATNRFSAEQGRSAAVGDQRGHAQSGTRHAPGLGRRSSCATTRCRGCRPPTTAATGEAPPFDRQQYSAALGGPLVARQGRAGSAPSSTATRTAAVLVGERDVADAHDPPRPSPPAPLDDFLGIGRVDWRASDADTLTLRYAVEHADDTGGEHARPRDRLGLAAADAATTATTRCLGTWTRIVGAAAVNTLRVELQRRSDNAIDPVDARAASSPSRASRTARRFRVPQATDAEALPARRHASSWVQGAHTPARRRRVSQHVRRASTSASSATGRIELVQDFAAVRPATATAAWTTTTCCSRSRSAAASPTRTSCSTTADNNYLAVFVQDDWRVTPAAHAQRRPALRDGHRRQEHLPATATSTRSCSRSSRATATRDLEQLRPAPRLRLGDRRRRACSVHGGYGIYYDRVTLEIMSLERGLDGRALPIEVRAGNVFFLDPEHGPRAAVRADVRRTRSPASSCPGAGAVGHQHHRQHAAEPERAAVQPRASQLQAAAATSCCGSTRPQPRHALHHRPADRRGLQPGGGRARPRREPRVERRHAATTRLLVERSRSAGAAGSSCAPSYTLAQGAQLRERRPDPVRRRARSTRTTCEREYGPTPNDQRHRFALSGSFVLPAGAAAVAPIWTLASGVPMDILMPDGSTPRADASSATRAGASSRPPPSSTRYITTLNAGGRRRRRAAAARARRRALQRRLRLARPARCRGRFALGAALQPRGDRRGASTSST